MTMTTTIGGACAIFYTRKEDNVPINKTAKKHPKNKSLCQKESANNQNEHVARANGAQGWGIGGHKKGGPLQED